MTSKVKGQGHKFTSSVRLMSASSEFREENAVFVSLEAGGGLPCRPNPAATLLVALVLEKDETRIMKWRVLNVEASQ